MWRRASLFERRRNNTSPAREPPQVVVRHGGGSGYAAVDALVALTILASTLVFGVAAAHQGLLAARAGLEARQASDLMRQLLEGARGGAVSAVGATDLFAWRLDIGPPVKSFSAASLCAHAVTVSNLRTQRVYSARTDEICPAAPE